MLHGQIEFDYIYATLLSKHLVPFGYEKLYLIALPIRVDDQGAIRLVEEQDFVSSGHFNALRWFKAVAAKRDALKKAESRLSFLGQINYQNKLTSQRTDAAFKLLYNTNGTHISAAVLNQQDLSSNVQGRSTKGFIVDFKTYYEDFTTPEEAQYMCAILNAPVVDAGIKKYQTRGIYAGERDIARTPFEACAIPPFDANNADHVALARLSAEAHKVVKFLKDHDELSGSVYKIRDQARAATAKQIAAIDELARRVLGMESG